MPPKKRVATPEVASPLVQTEEKKEQATKRNKTDEVPGLRNSDGTLDHAALTKHVDSIDVSQLEVTELVLQPAAKSNTDLTRQELLEMVGALPDQKKTEIYLVDIAHSSFPVVVYTDELVEKLDFSALHVKESVLRREIALWLRGRYADVNIGAVLQKCAHHTALHAIAKECEDLEDVKWNRLVDMIMRLQMTKIIDLSGISSAVNEIYGDVSWDFVGTKSLLSRRLEELDVTEVMELMYNHHAELVEAEPDSSAYDLCAGLCASYEILEWCFKFELEPLDRLCADAKTKWDKVAL